MSSCGSNAGADTSAPLYATGDRHSKSHIYVMASQIIHTLRLFW